MVCLSDRRGRYIAAFFDVSYGFNDNFTGFFEGRLFSDVRLKDKTG